MRLRGLLPERRVGQGGFQEADAGLQGEDSQSEGEREGLVCPAGKTVEEKEVINSPASIDCVMKHLKVLNSKEVKKIIKSIEEQFGEFELGDYVFFRNSEDKIFLISRKFAELDEQKVRINNLGLYFGKEEVDGFRLTIEGAQLVSPKRNVVGLSLQQTHSWMRGEDIEAGDVDVEGYVVLKHGEDILGCGKFKEGRVLNSIPKGRRVSGNLPGDPEGIRTVR